MVGRDTYCKWGDHAKINACCFHAPSTAIMRVYRDFFSYRSGIYRHSAAATPAEERSAYHSVRLIGWGEERVGYDVVKYWVSISNSVACMPTIRSSSYRVFYQPRRLPSTPGANGGARMVASVFCADPTSVTLKATFWPPTRTCTSTFKPFARWANCRS